MKFYKMTLKKIFLTNLFIFFMISPFGSANTPAFTIDIAGIKTKAETNTSLGRGGGIKKKAVNPFRKEENTPKLVDLEKPKKEKFIDIYQTSDDESKMPFNSNPLLIKKSTTNHNNQLFNGHPESKLNNENDVQSDQTSQNGSGNNINMEDIEDDTFFDKNLPKVDLYKKTNNKILSEIFPEKRFPLDGNNFIFNSKVPFAETQSPIKKQKSNDFIDIFQTDLEKDTKSIEKTSKIDDIEKNDKNLIDFNNKDVKPLNIVESQSNNQNSNILQDNKPFERKSLVSIFGPSRNVPLKHTFKSKLLVPESVSYVVNSDSQSGSFAQLDTQNTDIEKTFKPEIKPRGIERTETLPVLENIDEESDDNEDHLDLDDSTKTPQDSISPILKFKDDKNKDNENLSFTEKKPMLASVFVKNPHLIRNSIIEDNTNTQNLETSIFPYPKDAPESEKRPFKRLAQQKKTFLEGITEHPNESQSREFYPSSNSQDGLSGEWPQIIANGLKDQKNTFLASRRESMNNYQSTMHENDEQKPFDLPSIFQTIFQEDKSDVKNEEKDKKEESPTESSKVSRGKTTKESRSRSEPVFMAHPKIDFQKLDYRDDFNVNLKPINLDIDEDFAKEWVPVAVRKTLFHVPETVVDPRKSMVRKSIMGNRITNARSMKKIRRVFIFEVMECRNGKMDDLLSVFLEDKVCRVRV